MMTRLTIRVPLLGALLFIVLGLAPAHAQVSATDLLLRLDSLEGQVRRLTGTIEQLQYRNQQLETNLRKMQEDYEFRFQELGGKGNAKGGGSRASAPSPTPPMPPSAPQQQRYTPQEQPTYVPPPSRPAYSDQPAQPSYEPSTGRSGRRSDAFDPSQDPNAPGVPRQLGSVYASGNPGDAGQGAYEQQSGAPLDLSGGRNQGGLPAPPPRNPNATGAMATQPPSQSPRDEYDLAYGYLIRKDYDLADQSFRAFLTRYPRDRLADDAQYGLGESLFLRRNYHDAADVFLALTRERASSPRAPEAMLRLGQSLAALKEKDMACGAFAEVGRKYPRVSPTVKRTVAREQKRVGCQ